MRFWPVFLVFTFTAFADSPKSPETPSALASEPNGWTDLLADAGPSLKGWTRGTIPPGKPLKPESQWSLDAKTGVLLCEGDGGHEWLRWDREVADGTFHVEWRFTPVAGKKGYNAGIYARNSADATVWHQGQTGDGSGGFLFGESPGADGKLKGFNFGKGTRDRREKPPGEWNTYEMTFKGKELSLWANGAVVTTFAECGLARGYVGLEAEGYRVEFRNVKLRASAR